MKHVSKIIITDESSIGIKIEVEHDALPTGPRKDWNSAALVAEKMLACFLAEAERYDIKPSMEASRNSTTGEINIITRKNEN